MPDLSQHAQFLLNQLRGHLRGANQTGFYVVEDVPVIAFGNMLGSTNTIPPAASSSGKEKQETMLALNELVEKKFVLFHGYTEGRKTYVLNPTKPN